MIKKLVLALVLIPMTLGLTACTDEEAALGVGAIGGAIVGAAIVSGAGSHQHHGQRCESYRYCDSWGRCDYRQRCERWSATIGSPEAHALAEKYSLSVIGAEKVVTAVSDAKAGSLAGFHAVGFNAEDMSAISNGEMPSEVSISSVSKNLISSRASVRALLKDTVKEARFQREQEWMNRSFNN